MPNISSLTMPDGIVYSIKDSQARKDIEDIKKNSSGSGGSGGSGGGAFVVNGTLNDGSQTEGTIDKTDTEIYNAAISGKAVHLCINETGTTSAYCLTQFTRMELSTDNYFYYFACVGFDSGYIATINFGNGRFEYESHKLS